jgi:glutamate-ammonia-ligase adenylyltransferase
MEHIPEAASWLDGDAQLRPRSQEALHDETNAILACRARRAFDRRLCEE